MSRMRLFGSFLLTVGGLLVLAAPASAHAELESSSPADGASLSTAPTQIKLTFSEAVTLQADPVTVTGPGGEKWLVGTPSIAGPVVTVPVTPSGPAGAYTLTYKSVADDGDKQTGTVHFTLTAPASPSTSAAPTTSASPAAQTPTTQSPAAAGQPSDSGGFPTWLWIVIAVVVVLAAVVVALRLRRARQ